ncbi:hypothetical protein M1271_00180 [Patescibacteria group bacterium]|nr:hypothetical protein [Patescibacteria group bacterium]MCL5797777.1 hypothetical protein [Patescibacteria group bacterium]
MNSGLFLGISITASFLGGMVALFAPCCITFLLPSYLGTVFRDRKKILLLTLVFATGLGSILIPVALGMRVIVSIFDQFHTTTYLIGAFFMFILGLMTLFEMKLPAFPLPHYTMPQKTTVLSTFVLGLFSGVTSSCCAPVLFAAITLSSLSPTLFSALIVSIVYVLGIVFPLFFLSLLYDKLTNQFLYKIKKNIDKPLKIAASITFIASSFVIAYLAITGRIVMSENSAYGTSLRLFIFNISTRLRNPIFDLLTITIIAILFIIIIKEAKNESRKKN